MLLRRLPLRHRQHRQRQRQHHRRRPQPPLPRCRRPPATTGEATSTFDGTGCTYDGPTEFGLNTETTFTFINTSEGTSAGYGIWKVPDGTTVGDITEKSIFGIGADRTPDMRAHTLSSSPGIDRELVVALDTPGLWAVNCYTPNAGLGVDYPATVFVVSDN